MEGTGAPFRGRPAMAVNALKAIPGRKTDMKDA